jgi:4-carboxymuconolactone decarboxylase
MAEANNMERWNKGLDVIDKVYGPGSREMMAGREGSEYVAETVNHLFGDIWALRELSIRDKRMLVVGATAMLGRADLIAIQLAGAIANGEFTDAQLDEMPLFMMFYCGGGNTTALFQGIQQARARAKEMAEKQPA